jgi:peptidoglycan glycosyltransferase
LPAALPPLVRKLLEPDTLPAVVFLLKLLFFGLVLTVLRQMFRFREAASLSHLAPPRKLYLVYFAGIILLFLAALGYQASWQLAGFARPQFVDFMARYNHRPVNPVERMERGRILDRRGEVLARNRREGKTSSREYPQGEAFCHLLGYVHPRYGLTGLEAAENDYLMGRSAGSWPELRRFALNVLRFGPIRGNDLTLTLDARLQRLAVELLRDKRGAVVAIRPQDGAVLVLASAPGFDPNHLTPALFQGDEATARLLNRAIQGLYPPGSVFKLVMTALALEDGFDGTLTCSAEGYTPTLGEKKIRDHEYYEYQRAGKRWEGFGELDLPTALARSSNVFFAQLGVIYRSERIRAFAERCLFNRPLVLHEGSSRRIVAKPSELPALKPRNLIGMARQAIGQGEVLATPFHMALLTAGIAAQGAIPRPRLTERAPAGTLTRFADTAVARKLAGYMRRVVTEGTAAGADLPGIPVAGKTGTAQNPRGEDHSWFVCFAPYPRPALALAVLVEHGGYGATGALPIARRLLEEAGILGLLEAPAPASSREERP